jgi:hypothetical protein
MKELFFLLILSGLTSCGMYRPKWIRTETGGKQAVKKTYSLSKENPNFNNLIDTSSVYVSETAYVTTNRKGEIIREEHNTYGYIRFSSSGEMFIRDRIEEKITDNLYNEMKRGQFAFYQINGDILKIETYNHDTKMFEFWYGKIQKNGDILFFKNKGRPWWAYKGKLNYLYRKTPANLKTKIVFPE